jgi:hypothetical protein
MMIIITITGEEIFPAGDKLLSYQEIPYNDVPPSLTQPASWFQGQRLQR